MENAATQLLDRRTEQARTGLEKEALKRDFLDNLYYYQGKFPGLATENDYYTALSITIRDRLLQRWVSTATEYTAKGSRTVAYLSAEFLVGQHLGNNLVNLGIYDDVKETIEDLGLDFEALLRHEPEPGLGNGGLGRLAACFLDSMATLELPSLGYGIRYEFGIFHQDIVDGWQMEKTDKWLRFGNPWEIVRPEWAVDVMLGGHTETYQDERGRLRKRWIPETVVNGVPYDTPIVGFRNNTANTLRLWRAEAPESFDFAVFNRGDYYGAVDAKVTSENLTKVLYPNDENIRGKRLRLEQQFFFVSCSLQDMLRILQVQGLPFEQFHEKFTIQLNDTHPAVAVAELMRLLLDENGLDWNVAWSICQKTFAFTNHTLLPEALERWSLQMFGELLPRHLEIIYEINDRFLAEVRVRFLGDDDRVRRMSLIDETDGRSVRMAHLACVGSYAINGVAGLHSDLLKADVLKDFYDLWPEKFSNKTNGVTPRRFVVLSNPGLSDLVTEAIGNGWPKELEQLRLLEPYADDAAFGDRWREVKRDNKQALAEFAFERTGVSVSADSIYDIQVKRIHEYKRQHLNILHVIALYNRLKNDRNAEMHPRTFFFGGKAAPSYHVAKLMIKLITSVGDVINRDPAVRDLIKVVFLPNFNVTNAQLVYPAAEVSEQISTAGKEASGTGNMKFCMNGAVTIGTLDGANIEIRNEVGEENFFLFGMTADEVYQRKTAGYNPMTCYTENPELREVIDLVRGGLFSRGDTELFRPLMDHLLDEDRYMVLADFESYADCQIEVDQAYRDTDRWTRMSILNTARSGHFSSDRTIGEYSEEIWDIDPVPIRLLAQDEVNVQITQ